MWTEGGMQEVVGVALLGPVQVLGIRSPGAAPVLVSRKLLVGEEGWKYSTRAKRFVRPPFYTKSVILHHPLTLRNVYENQRKCVLALGNL